MDSFYILGSPSQSTDNRITLSNTAKSKAFSMSVLGGGGFVGPLRSGPSNYSSSRICIFPGSFVESCASVSPESARGWVGFYRWPSKGGRIPK